MLNYRSKKNLSKNTKKSQKTLVKRSSAKLAQNGKKSKSPLKRSTLGFEVELFILDKNGKMVDKADKLLKKLKEKKRNQGAEITQEIGKSQIEIGAYPSLEANNTMEAMIDNLKLLLYTADEEGLMICPLATYPGKFKPAIRTENHYVDKVAIFGKERLAMSGTCVGFHFHYELPWGVFDYKKKNLKKLINSKNKQSLVNSFNFLVAADPALTVFMQSSPFYQGKFLAKDSRMLVYRGGEDLDYDGLHTDHQEFGGLPDYNFTGTDIIHRIDQRYKDWLKAVKAAGIKVPTPLKSNSILAYNWTPVKINAHGTIEQRGMDMNYPSIIVAVSTMISTILKAIQEDYISVFIADVAIKEPFKFRKKVIYIPPDAYVKKELQKRSAYKGFEDESVWYYAKRLLQLAKILGGKKVEPALAPLDKMIKEKKTVSDQIISEAKKLGYTDFKKPMPVKISTQIAINHSKRLFEDIVLVEKMIHQNK